MSKTIDNRLKQSNQYLVSYYYQAFSSLLQKANKGFTVTHSSDLKGIIKVSDNQDFLVSDDGKAQTLEIIKSNKNNEKAIKQAIDSLALRNSKIVMNKYDNYLKQAPVLNEFKQVAERVIACLTQLLERNGLERGGVNSKILLNSHEIMFVIKNKNVKIKHKFKVDYSNYQNNIRNFVIELSKKEYLEIMDKYNNQKEIATKTTLTNSLDLVKNSVELSLKDIYKITCEFHHYTSSKDKKENYFVRIISKKDKEFECEMHLEEDMIESISESTEQTRALDKSIKRLISHRYYQLYNKHLHIS